MILGIDTSNYTTSLALYDDGYAASERQILPVREGERGLRQSDALFWHIKQLPSLFEALPNEKHQITGVSISSAPRNVDGSYMPVFLAGESFGTAISEMMNVPLYRFSHQEGHIMAGIYSADAFDLLEKPFLSVHLSGGTLEILKTEYKDNRFTCEIVGKTLDISAGQLIDRVGVDLGMKFPCGKEFDSLSSTSSTPVKLPVSVKGADINFSGAETKCKDFYTSCKKEDICLGVLECIEKSLEKAINYCISEYKTDTVLMAGGVASNSYIRSELHKNINSDVIFASSEFSTDNALGTAILGYYKHKKSHQ